MKQLLKKIVFVCLAYSIVIGLLSKNKGPCKDTCTSDEEQDTCYIPMEEVLEFKSRRNIKEKRQELRQNLRQKFAQLCVSTPQSLMLQKQDKESV